MSRRSIAALALVVATALTAGLTAASAKPNASVTLTMLMPATYREAQDILNKNFERVYPDIHIDVTYMSALAQLETLLVTQLQAGNAADIFFTRGARSRIDSVWPFAEAGRLLDLSGRPWQSRIYPPAKKQAMWKGKVYAWPGVVLPYAAVYNVDLFKQLQLKVPQRFSEVLATCRQVRAAGKVLFAQPLGEVAGGTLIGRQRMDQYVYSVDPNWSDKRAANKVTFASSPLWRRALQSIVDMKDAGCFQDGAQGTSRAQAYALVANGSAVATMGVSADIPSLVNINPNLKLSMFNLPPDDPKNATISAASAYMITANAATKYPQQVKTYIDFFAREQQSSLFAKVAVGIAPLDAKKGKLPATMTLLKPLVKNGKLREGAEAEWPSPNIFSDGYATGILGLFTGQTTVDGILKKMDDLWNAAG